MNVSIHIDEIARVCHEALNAIEDTNIMSARIPWIKLSQSEKESVLESVEYYILHPTATAAMRHNEWVAQHVNASNMDHKLMVPYTKLGRKEQAQACVFKSIVRSMTQ